MEQQDKKLDLDARLFIKSAYRVGMSVILIYRFLHESNYDCTMTEIHKTLWDFNIFPDNYNCSFDSLIWRRYLTNMIEFHEVSTLDQFETLALGEAKDYFNVDSSAFTNHWNDWTKFTQELKSPLDPNLTIRALHYFGYTTTTFSNKLRKKDIISTPGGLYDAYMIKARGYPFSSQELKLRPKNQSSDDLREFWKHCYKIGKDVGTILAWSEVFTGTNTSAMEIEAHITLLKLLSGGNL